MPFSILRDDITHACADAIVLPSNPHLQLTGGAGYDVARIAGLQDLQEACNKVAPCPVGEAASTPAFEFPARFLIHAVGPVWEGPQSESLLTSAYRNALHEAERLGAESVALPLISAGTFGCPAEISLRLALDAIKAFCSCSEIEVQLYLFDRNSMKACLGVYGDVAEYVDDVYVDAHREEAFLNNYYQAMPQAEPLPQWDDAPYAPMESASLPSMPQPEYSAAPIAPAAGEKASSKSSFWSRFERRKKPAEEKAYPGAAFAPDETVGSAYSPQSAPLQTAPLNLDDMLASLDESFSTTLISIIDQKGLKDAEVYKRANMSKQLFSKIRSNVDYRPKKATVLSLCIALELDLGQTNDLLGRAGYALTHSSKFDVIVEFFILKGKYDIFEINEVLYSFDQPLLG